eukprot:7334657-Karenia_brevis.AAC.1
MGIILALLAPLAVHVAVDTANVVIKALLFKDLTSQGPKTVLCFPKLPMAIFGKKICHILKLRGPRSSVISWTK